MAKRVKTMDKENILLYREWMRQCWFSPSGEKVICAELKRRGLSVPGFEPFAIYVKEEEEDESSGRPPYY